MRFVTVAKVGAFAVALIHLHACAVEPGGRGMPVAVSSVESGAPMPDGVTPTSESSGHPRGSASVSRISPGSDERTFSPTPIPVPNQAVEISAHDRDPAQLLDLGAEPVIGLLGSPSFVRHDATALVWQYRAPGCVLDVFLYRQPSEYRVTHVEIRSPVARDISQEECMVDLIRRRHASRSG